MPPVTREDTDLGRVPCGSRLVGMNTRLGPAAGVPGAPPPAPAPPAPPTPPEPPRAMEPMVAERWWLGGMDSRPATVAMPRPEEPPLAEGVPAVCGGTSYDPGSAASGTHPDPSPASPSSPTSRPPPSRDPVGVGSREAAEEELDRRRAGNGMSTLAAADCRRTCRDDGTPGGSTPPLPLPPAPLGPLGTPGAKGTKGGMAESSRPITPTPELERWVWQRTHSPNNKHLESRVHDSSIRWMTCTLATVCAPIVTLTLPCLPDQTPVGADRSQAW